MGNSYPMPSARPNWIVLRSGISLSSHLFLTFPVGMVFPSSSLVAKTTQSGEASSSLLLYFPLITKPRFSPTFATKLSIME